jgi:hypothetical protein
MGVCLFSDLGWGSELSAGLGLVGGLGWEGQGTAGHDRDGELSVGQGRNRDLVGRCDDGDARLCGRDGQHLDDRFGQGPSDLNRKRRDRPDGSKQVNGDATALGGIGARAQLV